MYQGRFTGQPSVVRKSRVEGKQSLLPKPRRPGSTDRASVEARRPSAAHRSSSADTARTTLAVSGRASREASASKIPMNRRSRSQQPERFGQSFMTPLRSSQLSRATTTPVRTPSEDSKSRIWQTSLERALAFVTIKDQRPVSTVAWQRAECSRIQEALSARGASGGALVRPLTITRFVEICAGLLTAALRQDAKLNNDNYVAKLPNLAKRFLYPGTVSKSWLKTVNTLHAFPQALAFMSYFVDLVTHIELPVSDDWLYMEKDELACLRRDYVDKCWVRFQDPDHDFGDLNTEYLHNLKQLLGDDELKTAQLRETIAQCEATLEDESEIAARAEEVRVRARRDTLAVSLRACRSQRRELRAGRDQQEARRDELAAASRAIDQDIAGAKADMQQLKRELDEQTMTVAERGQLLDELDYATRVIDSKRTLADQISKMLLNKETELGLWQKRTLDSCVEYKQALIHLAAQFPELAALAVDEKELMEAACAAAVSLAVDSLRAQAQRLSGQRAQLARERAAHRRQRAARLEEARAQTCELEAEIERKQQALDAELAKDASEAATWAAERQALAAKLDELSELEEQYAKAQSELESWEQQDQAYRAKLAEMRDYIDSLRVEASRKQEAGRRLRADKVLRVVQDWHRQLDRVEEEERRLEEAPNQHAAHHSGAGLTDNKVEKD